MDSNTVEVPFRGRCPYRPIVQRRTRHGETNGHCREVRRWALAFPLLHLVPVVACCWVNSNRNGNVFGVKFFHWYDSMLLLCTALSAVVGWQKSASISCPRALSSSLTRRCSHSLDYRTVAAPPRPPCSISCYSSSCSSRDEKNGSVSLLPSPPSKTGLSVTSSSRDTANIAPGSFGGLSSVCVCVIVGGDGGLVVLLSSWESSDPVNAVVEKENEKKNPSMK